MRAAADGVEGRVAPVSASASVRSLAKVGEVLSRYGAEEFLELKTATTAT